MIMSLWPLLWDWASNARSKLWVKQSGWSRSQDQEPALPWSGGLGELDPGHSRPLATPEQSALSPSPSPLRPESPVSFPCYYTVLEHPLASGPSHWLSLFRNALPQVSSWLAPSSLHSKAPLGKATPDGSAPNLNPSLTISHALTLFPVALMLSSLSCAVFIYLAYPAFM